MKARKVLTLLTMSSIALCACDEKYYEYVDPFPDKSVFIQDPEINADKKIKNVIVMIGDGMGYNQVNAGGLYKGAPLCFANKDDPRWTYHALVNTDSLTSRDYELDTSKSLIYPDQNSTLYDQSPSPYGTKEVSNETAPYTDSAAAGTALATGFKTINGRIGRDQYGDDLRNITELARTLGKKTGVISSDYLDGATPNAYLVHINRRDYTVAILKQIKTSRVNLIMAKEPTTWTKAYKRDFTKFGWEIITPDISKLDNQVFKQMLLHNGVSLDENDDNTLAKETKYALDYLSDDPDGFFLMVEGAYIDKKAHANEMIPMFEEIMAFDRAVQTTIDWASTRDDTLVLVTADHECGSLCYNYGATNKQEMLDSAKFLSENHSRSRVLLDVYGDISEFTTKYESSFSTLEGMPYWDNTFIYNLCSAYL